MKSYWVGTVVANLPNSDTAWYIISITNKSSISANAYVTQIATPSGAQNENRLFIRHRYVSAYNPIIFTWTSWKEL